MEERIWVIGEVECKAMVSEIGRQDLIGTDSAQMDMREDQGWYGSARLAVFASYRTVIKHETL